MASCQGLFQKDFGVSRVFEELTQLGVEVLSGHGIDKAWPEDGPARERSHRDGKRWWSPASAYERALREILRLTGVLVPEGFFREFLRDRKKQRLESHILDLFGSGFFVEDQSLAISITGMRWEHYDRDALPSSYPAKAVPREVLGHMLHPDTWRKLDETMYERKISGFDLVTMVPVGAWANALGLTSDPREQALALSYIIRQCVTRLNPNGRFYFEVHLSNLKIEDLTLNPNLDPEIRRLTWKSMKRRTLTFYLTHEFRI